MLPVAELLPLIRSDAFRDFVLREALEDAGTSSFDLQERLEELNADTLVVLAYQGLIECMQAYPQIHALHPIWKPLIDDNDLVVSFKVAINGDERQLYGYSDRPEFVPQDDLPFTQMVDCCENIHSNVWSKFVWEDLNQRKGPYTSVGELEAEMRDNRPFIAKLEQWVIEQHTTQATGKPMRRAGL